MLINQVILKLNTSETAGNAGKCKSLKGCLHVRYQMDHICTNTNHTVVVVY